LAAEWQIHPNGDRIEQLMRDAGFIDIKPRKIKFDLGDWRPGIIIAPERLTFRH
jgi:hypothetical protein